MLFPAKNSGSEMSSLGLSLLDLEIVAPDCSHGLIWIVFLTPKYEEQLLETRNDFTDLMEEEEFMTKSHH